MSFFSTGYGNLEVIEQKIQSQSSGAGKPWRFRMKAGETRNVIFLDDNPPIIEEHQLKIDGNWGNFFTCLKNLGQSCPLCDAGDRPSTTGFYTVIDRTEFQRKDGTKGKDSVRILAAKFKSLKQFKKFSTKYNGLVGVEFEVERTGDKAPSIGDLYVKEDKHDEHELLAILNSQRKEPVSDIAAVLPDWEEYLKPKMAAELAKVVGMKVAAYDDEDSVDFE